MCVYGVYVYVERYVCIGMQVVSTYVKKKRKERGKKKKSSNITIRLEFYTRNVW